MGYIHNKHWMTYVQRSYIYVFIDTIKYNTLFTKNNFLEKHFNYLKVLINI